MELNDLTRYETNAYFVWVCNLAERVNIDPPFISDDIVLEGGVAEWMDDEVSDTLYALNVRLNEGGSDV